MSSEQTPLLIPKQQPGAALPTQQESNLTQQQQQQQQQQQHGESSTNHINEIANTDTAPASTIINNSTHINKTSTELPKGIQKTVTPYILPADWKHSVCALTALFSITVGKVLNVLPPLAIKYAVDAITKAQAQSSNDNDNESSTADISSMDANANANAKPILYAIGAYFGLQTIIMLNGIVQDLAQRTVALDAERRFANQLFAHLQTLSLSYHLENHIGEITRIMNRGSDSISTLISSFLFYLFPTLFEAILVSAVFWKLVGIPSLAFATLTAIFFYLAFTVFVTKTRIVFRRKLIEASDAVGQKEVETLVNYETVSMFGRTQYEIEQYALLRQVYKDRRVEMLAMFALLEFGQKFIKLSGTSAGLIIAGLASVYGIASSPSGEMLSPGTFVIVQMYIQQLFQPLTQLGWQYRMITRAVTDLEKAAHMLNTQPDVQDAPHAIVWKEKEKGKGKQKSEDGDDDSSSSSCDIVFSNVTFQYKVASRRRALGTALNTTAQNAGGGGGGKHQSRRGRLAMGHVDDDVGGGGAEEDEDAGADKIKFGGVRTIDFTIRAGKTVALVGASGSGKTTIVRLILRMYDPDEGTVCVDGHNVKDLTQQSLRENIGVVAQDTILFNSTLRENIMYGKQNASEEEVWDAVRIAALEPFVLGLPDQLDTLVGERGMKLSGGERQRVGLARCIIKNPRLILLDEATSALDTATEKEIQDNIARVCMNKSRPRTTLMIAHRLSTARYADEIIVLDKGIVVERGSHSALNAKKGGRYADMWNIQTKQEEDEDEDEDEDGTEEETVISRNDSEPFKFV
jgi:ABC-type transport system involved in Fe-S cluster assembly fused permease/ATPase subunit